MSFESRRNATRANAVQAGVIILLLLRHWSLLSGSPMFLTLALLDRYTEFVLHTLGRVCQRLRVFVARLAMTVEIL